MDLGGEPGPLGGDAGLVGEAGDLGAAGRQFGDHRGAFLVLLDEAGDEGAEQERERQAERGEREQAVHRASVPSRR